MVSIGRHAWSGLKFPGNSSYPLAQPWGFLFVFVARLVGREQKCASGGAFSPGFWSATNQMGLLTSVFSVELMAALLESVFYRRQVVEAGCGV